MNKDLDLTKILKDCPKGMKLDCTMYENVTFSGIDFKEQSDWKLVSNKEVSIIINGVRYDSSCEDLGCECDTCHLRTSCDRLSSSVNEACQEILGSGYNFKKSDKKFEK